MSSNLPNRSSFYFIDSVTNDNFYLDFDEGGPEITATVPVGDYTMEELADVIQDAMNSAGTQTFTVTLLRSERKYNISSTGTFSLLVFSGSHVGADIFPLIGFTGADRTASNTYTGDTEAGFIYQPQFLLQNYVDIEDLQKSLSVSINKSANGKKVEIVKFGVEKFFEFDIMFITDIEQDGSSFIENNPTGLEDARVFMRFCVTKKLLEFMPDRYTPNVFYKVLLEKTTEDKDGTGYRLKELYAKGIAGYFETGLLTFKLVEDD